MSKIVELLASITADVDKVFWSAASGSLHAMWRGRSLELRANPHMLLVADLELSRGDGVSALYVLAQDAFLRGMIDNVPHVVGRRLVLGGNWCCAVQVAEVLVSGHGYIVEYLRRQPEPDEMILAMDFRITSGRLFLGNDTGTEDSVPVSAVYQALLDTFLSGEDLSDISVDWDADHVEFVHPGLN